MSSTILAKKKVRTNKEHLCCDCLRTLPKKATMWFVSQLELGYIEHFYYCDDCRLIKEKYRDEILAEEGTTDYQGCIARLRYRKGMTIEALLKTCE